MLKTEGLTSLSGMDILEVGCGHGGVLSDLVKYDAEPGRCTGIDLLHTSLSAARLRLPSSAIYCADGQSMPFPACQFDLVLQFTAFSSVLNMQIKTNMAAEMLRVLKQDGAILWYDFWWNPTNPHTAGIRPSEIKALFPNCEYIFRRITLAPPIAKLFVHISWPLVLFLESLILFNSHYLVMIKKAPSEK
jgi:ubiquinone/menaquinone biosynthesis C-methylase UbiE